MITVIGSLKGGTGKSTLTFNLGIWLRLAGAQVQLIDLDPQATLTDVAEVRAEEDFQPAVEIKHAEALDSLSTADEVLIDVGTADLEAMKKALCLADRVLIPVPPSQADIWSAQRFVKFVTATVADKEPKPKLYTLINRGDTHHAVRETKEAAAALVTLPGVHFVKQRLSQRTVYRRSFSEGLAVFELEPRGKGARELTDLSAVFYPDILK